MSFISFLSPNIADNFDDCHSATVMGNKYSSAVIIVAITSKTRTKAKLPTLTSTPGRG